MGRGSEGVGVRGCAGRTVTVDSLLTQSVHASTIGSMTVQPFRLRYSIREASEMLGVSTKTIRRRIAAGQLQSIRDGSKIFITWDELDRYGKRGTVDLPKAS